MHSCPYKRKIIIKIQLCYFARLKTQRRNLLSNIKFQLIEIFYHIDYIKVTLKLVFQFIKILFNGGNDDFKRITEN